jgi:hypothetical protein
MGVKTLVAIAAATTIVSAAVGTTIYITTAEANKKIINYAVEVSNQRAELEYYNDPSTTPSSQVHISSLDNTSSFYSPVFLNVKGINDVKVENFRFLHELKSVYDEDLFYVLKNNDGSFELKCNDRLMQLSPTSVKNFNVYIYYKVNDSVYTDPYENNSFVNFNIFDEPKQLDVDCQDYAPYLIDSNTT